MKLSELKYKPPKILLYGPPGSGKTAFALSAGEGTHVLDLDEGVMTGATLEDPLKVHRLRCEVDVIGEDDPTKGLAFGKVRTQLLRVANECNKNTYSYKVLVLDSLTAFVEYSMRSTLFHAGGDVERKLEIQHYGTAFQQIKNMFAIIKSLPISVIVVAHDMVDDKGNVILATSGQKLPYELPRYFDEIWYAKKKLVGGVTNYTLQTAPSYNLTCRSRFNIRDGISMDNGMRALYKIMKYDLPTTEGEITPKDIAETTPPKIQTTNI